MIKPLRQAINEYLNMTQHDSRQTGPALIGELETVLNSRIELLGPIQNKLRALVGESRGDYLQMFENLGRSDKTEVVELLHRAQRIIAQTEDVGSRNTGLAQPRIWKIDDEITGISAVNITLQLESVQPPVDPLSAALGQSTMSTLNMVTCNGQKLGQWDDTAGVKIADCERAIEIKRRSGGTIYVFEVPLPLRDQNGPYLLGGYVSGADMNSCYEAKFRPLARGRESRILLPVLSDELQLEGHPRIALLKHAAWGGKLVASQRRGSSLITFADYSDLFVGIPTKRTFAMHDVAQFKGRFEAGISDGRNFIPAKRPARFDDDNRILKALEPVTEKNWPNLIRAIRGGFLAELLPQGLIESKKSDVLDLVNGAPQDKSEPATGCFHGYNATEQRVSTAANGKPYILFEIRRPESTPVYVVDTPEVGAAYIFIDRNRAVDLVTGAISIREAWGLAHARVVHSGAPVEWMEKFHLALDNLGVPRPQAGS